MSQSYLVPPEILSAGDKDGAVRRRPSRIRPADGECSLYKSEDRRWIRGQGCGTRGYGCGDSVEI